MNAGRCLYFVQLKGEVLILRKTIRTPNELREARRSLKRLFSLRVRVLSSPRAVQVLARLFEAGAVLREARRQEEAAHWDRAMDV